jgi:hypothetical protein
MIAEQGRWIADALRDVSMWRHSSVMGNDRQHEEPVNDLRSSAAK